jgi:cell division initiation protein
MDLSAKLLREVEFSTSLRGYNTDEVDEFLEKLAVAVDDTQEKMRQFAYRAERAERAVTDRGPDEDADSIRRTLVLAQRTADLAVREAQEQAAVLMDSARTESDKLLTDAREEAQNLATEAERRHGDELARLQNERDQVSRELRELSELLETERKRLSESLHAALRYVERTLPPPTAIPETRQVPGAVKQRAMDDIEAQINEDAAAAAPSAPPADDEDDGGEDAGRVNLAAVPPPEDSGPNTEAWQSESLTIFGEGEGKAASVTPDPSSLGFRGSDWIA